MRLSFIEQILDSPVNEALAQIAQISRPSSSLSLAAALRRSLRKFLCAEVARMFNGGGQALSLYPHNVQQHLGRLAGRLCDDGVERFLQLRSKNWRLNVIEMFQRLERDWPTICANLGCPIDSRIAGVSSPLGDIHNGGRSVYELSFEDDFKLIYKPRDVMSEYTFGRVVAWLRSNNCEPDLFSCRACPRPGYGWTAFVPTLPCETTEQGEAFCERQGVYLALFHLLRASDCVGDNVIVHGHHPVWIDTECVCTPQLKIDAAAWPGLPDWVEDSVLVTGMIYIGNDGGLPPRRGTGLAVSCMSDYTHIFDEHNVMRKPFVRAVMRGFEKAYTSVLKHLSRWQSNDGPVSWWQHHPVRVIPRPTWMYSHLLDTVQTAPESARDELMASIKGFLRRGRAGRIWPKEIVDGEADALLRGDIPYWHSSTSSSDIWTFNGMRAHDVATRSGYQRLRHGLATAGAADLTNQLWLIECFLQMPDQPTARNDSFLVG